MKSFATLGIFAAIFLAGTQCSSQPTTMEKNKTFAVVKSDNEWKELLSPAAYHILREKGTERAFTGEFWNNKKNGIYYCAGCNTAVFASDTKYKSGTGWPSFWKPLNDNSIRIVQDKSLGMVRDEVVCNVCGGHLGHMFNDGPKPTGHRYCLNSASLNFSTSNEDK